MRYLIKSDTIETLNLSVRATNALHRAGIHTVERLLQITKEDLLQMKNLGEKTVDETMEIIHCLCTSGEPYQLVSERINHKINTTTEHKNQTVFRNADGVLYIDIPIEDIQLPVRAYNCFINAGILHASRLISMSEIDLMRFENMGRKSIEQTLTIIKNLTFLPKEKITDPDTINEFLNTDQLCSAFVADIKEYIPIHAGQLYQQMYLVLDEFIKKHELKLCLEIISDELFLHSAYENHFLNDAIKKTILVCVEQNDYGVPLSFISDKMPNHLRNTSILNEIVKELIENKMLIYTEVGTIIKKRPSVIEYAESLNKEQDRALFIGRLNGKTLEELGREWNITRERVRQIVAKHLRNRPKLEEDKYVATFQEYYISKNDFLLGFSETEYTYNYLALAYESGKIPVEELMENESYPVTYRKAAEKIKYKKFVQIGNERVRCTRNELSGYILRTYCKNTVTFDEFSGLYTILLEDLGLSDDPHFNLMDRGYENKLAASNHVLWKYGRRIRYYNMDEYDFKELLQELDLDSYHDIEYSALKFFREFPELMQSVDIRDEYELHNLLKKLCTQVNYSNISFKRMPHIEFGTADRDRQVLDILLASAPITNVDLAAEYENVYGIRASTVLANYLKNFDKYFYNGVYKVDVPMLPMEQASRMKEVLTEDFYTIFEAKRIYLREFPNADSKMLNPYTLKNLDFKVYANYAIRSTYSSAAEYYRTLLLKNDIVDAREFPKDFLNTLTYYTELYKQKANYDLLEFLPLQYVNISRLNAVGITKEQLVSYCSAVADKVERGQYFTLRSLRNRGFKHELDKLGFDEWFYSSLVIEDKKRFSYRRIGKTRVLAKGISEVTPSGFIEFIVEKQMSIDIDDLVELLSVEYGVNIDRSKIMEIVKNSSMYYDSIMEKIYIDYDTYFEEV